MGKRNIYRQNSHERIDKRVSDWEFGKRDVQEEAQKKANTPSVTKNTMWLIQYLLKCHETGVDRTAVR